MIALRHDVVWENGVGAEIRVMRAKEKNSASVREHENGQGMDITPEQIRLLRVSFAEVEAKAAVAGLVFYRNLFALDPSLRPLFQTSIELQSRKLMEALSFTVAALENPKQLVPVLEAMGRRHVSYGARDEHYVTVAAALLQTLSEMLGGAFTAEVRQAWTNALGLVAKIMKRGAANASVRKLRGE